MEICRSIAFVVLLLSIYCYREAVPQGSCGSSSYYRCRFTGDCQYFTTLCDGINNCGDNEDEQNCTVCPSSRPIKCNGTTSKCIGASDICNGNNNCGDNEDEDKCSSCPSDRPYKCGFSQCIAQRYRCDGGRNCVGGEDEINCDTCTATAVMCNSTKVCVSISSYACDGNPHCPNGEDEKICGTCPSNRPIKCNNTISTCIYPSGVCDGSSHCADGEDERNCLGCSGSAVLCNSTKTCVSSSYVCDGTSHCSNREDELNCDTCPSNRPLKCNGTTSTCIYSYYKCNGAFNCPDGEDEKNCTTPSTMSTVALTSPISNSTTHEENDKPKGIQNLATGAYAGIIVGCIVGGMIIAAIIFFLYSIIKQKKSKRRSKSQQRTGVQMEGISNSAGKISDDASNIVSSAKIQHSHNNMQATLDKVRPKENPYRNKVDNNSAVANKWDTSELHNSYTNLSDKGHRESMHYYASVQ